MSQARLSACMLIPHKGHTDTIQVYSVTVMTHVKALEAGHSSQGTSEPITQALVAHIFPNITFSAACLILLRKPCYPAFP